MPGITDPTQPYFKDGGWGWDGSVWHKLAMIFGYSDRWSENAEATSPNGTTVCATAVVPAGYVYVLNFAIAYHDDPAASRQVRIQLFDSANALEIADQTVAASVYVYSPAVSAVLKAGDNVRGVGSALATGKKIYLKIWGYKMKVAE